MGKWVIRLLTIFFFFLYPREGERKGEIMGEVAPSIPTASATEVGEQPPNIILESLVVVVVQPTPHLHLGATAWT